MYSQSAITLLEGRIGFGEPSSFPVPISDDHKTGTSGRLFSFFHRLVTLENLFATVDENDLTEARFNGYLAQIKTDAVRSALVKVLNQNELYDENTDYSSTIEAKPELFDEVIGYTLAISAIEQMISTSRVNIDAVNAALKYDKLKIELDGVRDANGRVLARGLGTKLNKAVYKATAIIFPDKLSVDNGNFW